MYLTFNPVNEDLSTIKSSIESCVSVVHAWMSSNCLKLNDDKSELLIFHSKRVPRPNITAINIREESISLVESCRNIGVTYDETLSFDEHIHSITKTVFWHLRSIYQIRHVVFCKLTWLRITTRQTHNMAGSTQLYYSNALWVLTQHVP